MRDAAPPSVDERAPARRLIRTAILFWIVTAALNAAAQVALRRELQPGEFGTVNTVLGFVMVLAAPLLGLNLAFAHGAAAPDESARLQAARPVIMETATLAWGAAAAVLLFLLLPLLELPSFRLHFFALLAAGVSLAAVLSASTCATTGRAGLWTGLVLAAGAIRLLISILLGHDEPWAQSGLAAVIAAGIVTALPALQARGHAVTLAGAWDVLRGGKHLVPFLATISVLFAVTLFSNADRIVAQSSFGTPNAAQMGYVDWAQFDDYQAAGLLARSLLWLTLPVLFLFRAQRAALGRTTPASLRGLWIYLGLLVGGDVLLVLFAPLLSLVFCGDARAAVRFIPGFAGAIFMLGLLQGIGIFALASRRYPECFLLGACSIAYSIGLYRYGLQPQLMTSCMFGGALVSLMAVLFLGIVRYARNHP